MLLDTHTHTHTHTIGDFISNVYTGATPDQQRHSGSSRNVY